MVPVPGGFMQVGFGPESMAGLSMAGMAGMVGVGPGGFVQDGFDSLSYEQLLQMFGDGSNQRPAAPRTISSLPEQKWTKMDAEEHPDSPCPICLDCFAEGDAFKRLPCKHDFHSPCIDKWLKVNGVCPICKQDLEDDDDDDDDDDEEDDDEDDEEEEEEDEEDDDDEDEEEDDEEEEEEEEDDDDEEGQEEEEE